MRVCREQIWETQQEVLPDTQLDAGAVAGVAEGDGGTAAASSRSTERDARGSVQTDLAGWLK